MQVSKAFYNFRVLPVYPEGNDDDNLAISKYKQMTARV